MNPQAPTSDDFAALKAAAAELLQALYAADKPHKLKEAIRELYAAAVLLVFMLATGLAPSARPPRPGPAPGFSGGGFRLRRSVWRTPTLVEALKQFKRETKAHAPKKVYERPSAFFRSVNVLRGVLDLCTDPHRYALRLAKKLHPRPTAPKPDDPTAESAADPGSALTAFKLPKSESAPKTPPRVRLLAPDDS